MDELLSEQEAWESSIVDDATGAYLVDDGYALRLCVMGEVYDPNAALPRGLRRPVEGGRDARSFVRDRMARKFGPDQRRWPMSARFFVMA
jgi:hypothetical protein